MTLPKILHRFLIPLIFFLIAYKAPAQIDEKVFEHKMQKIDSLSFYKMGNYDTLFYVAIVKKFRDREYRQSCYGWINGKDNDHILLLNIYGKEVEIERKEITQLNPIQLNQKSIDSLDAWQKKDSESNWGNFAWNYELVSWLYKKGKVEYSRQMLPKRKILFADSDLRNGFGSMYYDAMLSAYSYERNYPKAIAIGEHLSSDIFIGFEYEKEATKLTQQLKTDSNDFKGFRLPDSLKWGDLKKKLTRKEQIIYLSERLRLINCIQPGQPAWISYDMNQYSISYADATKMDISYWKVNKYSVINPFIELLDMKLNLSEVQLLLPYLLTDTFIPSYNYHRDFFPERNLHRLNWVVELLISEITHKVFVKRLDFDDLAKDQKVIEVDKIRKWCEDNANLSAKALTVKELRTAGNWTDFKVALRAAIEQKNDSLSTIVAQRFYDFDSNPSSNFPMLDPITPRGVLAQTMYDLGDQKYIANVRKWNADTSENWVNLWSSMFLLKYDQNDYDDAMTKLQTVLRHCDGTTYYPHAMDLLLAINDKRTLKLAEGILDKEGFQRLIHWDYYVEFIKKLLFVKSDYTFNFFITKLNHYTLDAINREHRDNDNVLTENDGYVLAVDRLRNDKQAYFLTKTNDARNVYIKDLTKWFNLQYSLFKEGKPNELHLEPKKVYAPNSFIDTYRR
jgi:hypothetical protein